MSAPAFSDNTSAHAADQHRCLAEAYDPITRARLLQAGVGGGWRCLEVGAGNGSVASWLAERVGPGGWVLATDLNPRHLVTRPRLSVLRHDIRHDPLPEAAFDLVHARQVLPLLPERIPVLHRMIGALRPGGLLQLDDLDIGYGPALLTPDRRGAQLYQRFLAAKAEAMAATGGDGCWGSRAAEAMRAAGLVEVDPVPHLTQWHPGSPGVRLQINHTHRLRELLLAAGMTEQDLTELRALLTHPGFRAASPVFYSVQGRRP
ncbi:methyltransferase domain-containing protein [Crossiella sp. CA-258035]|uniref:class I SAM-dependent methyltransferase n=1 Tax=Crossiella sp. CA-258035 TaxID=2981138 RepID=UPI0024BCFC16|nr:class I SAM-dependent methyltransferase [Crossiella sp. CA-258035]WHT22863.1 methyltransferase domain-containing protein [Crossiella sp. CA-258035]